MNILGKKKSKAVSSEPEGCCVKNSEAYVPIKYRINVVLADKLYNKELNKYLFANPYDDSIVICDSKNIEFDVQDNYWRVTDKFQAGLFTEINIKRVN